VFAFHGANIWVANIDSGTASTSYAAFLKRFEVRKAGEDCPAIQFSMLP